MFPVYALLVVCQGVPYHGFTGLCAFVDHTPLVLRKGKHDPEEKVIREGTLEYEWFGLDGPVDVNTFPAFLQYTSDDTYMPVEASLRTEAALSASNVPFELYIIPKGGIGISICTRQVNSE